MKVIAAKGMKCPMERRWRSYITDSEPVEVPETAYYTRLVRDGSLVRVEGAEIPPVGGEGGADKIGGIQGAVNKKAGGGK